MNWRKFVGMVCLEMTLVVGCHTTTIFPMLPLPVLVMRYWFRMKEKTHTDGVPSSPGLLQARQPTQTEVGLESPTGIPASE
jgi:hypothetical protein